MIELEKRVLTLEQQNRWLRIAMLCTGVAALVAVGLAATRRPSREVRAERFVVVDSGGTARAELGPAQGGASGLVLRDSAGQPRALLAVAADGSPRLSFATATGQSLAELTAYADAAPRLLLSSPEGHEFFEVALHVDGSSRLALSDARGPRLKLGISSSGIPALELMDPGMHGYAELSMEDSAPRLVLEDAQGELFRAPPRPIE
jgi:hypothetical protein